VAPKNEVKTFTGDSVRVIRSDVDMAVGDVYRIYKDAGGNEGFDDGVGDRREVGFHLRCGTVERVVKAKIEAGDRVRVIAAGYGLPLGYVATVFEHPQGYTTFKDKNGEDRDVMANEAWKHIEKVPAEEILEGDIVRVIEAEPNNHPASDAACMNTCAQTTGSCGAPGQIILPSGYPDDNPKTALGTAKPNYRHVPLVGLYQVGAVMELGAKKYGPCNWRDQRITASTYIAAIRRHMDAYAEGETLDPESGEHQLAHVAACCLLMLDGAACGKLNDDRPTNGAHLPAWLVANTKAQNQALNQAQHHQGAHPVHWSNAMGRPC
jgi:hypothetical protein